MKINESKPNATLFTTVVISTSIIIISIIIIMTVEQYDVVSC